MRTLITRLWLFIVAILVSPALSTATAAPQTERLTVNWYHGAKYLKPVIAAFTEESGIEVEVTDAYDKFDTDVILVSDYKSLTEAKKLNQFDRIKSPELDAIVPARWRDRDGYWYGVVLRARAIIYNKALVNPEDIRSLQDLADPKWHGKLALRSASNVYNRSLLAAMIVHEGHDAALEWVRAVRANAGTAPEYFGDTGNIWRVAKGEFPLSFVNTYYIAYEIARGSEHKHGLKLTDVLGVAWLGQDGYGQHVNVTGVGVSAGTARKDEALALVRFLLSTKGQALLSKHVFKYPIRGDVQPDAALQKFGDFKRDELNLNDMELHYDEVDAIYRAVGWQAWQPR